MSFSSFQASEIKDFREKIEFLERLRGDAAIARQDMRDKISELESEVSRLQKERDMWKANHDNQRNLKAAIIDRLDCGDRARKVVALTDRIHNLELALTEIAFGVQRPSEHPSGCVQTELSKEAMQKIASDALDKK